MPPKGYFVDTNLLILYVVGQEDPDIIAKHSRLESYTIDDYILLSDLITQVSQVFVTPNTLTETCNLLGQHGDPEKTRLFERLRHIIQYSNEVTVPSSKASANFYFEKLGLADAVLCEVATRDTPLLTVDFKLYLAALSERGEDAVLNFVNYRDQFLH